MADILSLNLPEHPLVAAVRIIARQLQRAVDLDDVAMCGSVELGGDVLREPADGEFPAVRVWHDALTSEGRAVQFHVGTWHVRLSLYVWFKALPADLTGDLAFQAQRENWCRYLLHRLEQPESGVTDNHGIMPTPHWSFDWTEPVTIDHTTAIQQIAGDYMAVFPPLFVTRIDLPLMVFDRSRESHA